MEDNQNLTAAPADEQATPNVGDKSKMSKWEIIAYSGGEIYGGGYAALLGVVLTFFLTNLILVGIKNAELYAAIIIVVSKSMGRYFRPPYGRYIRQYPLASRQTSSLDYHRRRACARRVCDNVFALGERYPKSRTQNSLRLLRILLAVHGQYHISSAFHVLERGNFHGLQRA